MAVNSSNSQSFSYDNLQRLTQATGGYGSFGFTYDKDGNRLSQTLGAATTNYGYRAASDLLATLSVGGVQTQQIGYTADGRMASFSPGIQAPGGQYITSLSYNQDARLSAVNAAGGALANYTYDAFGQRVVKTISGGGNLYQYGQDGLLLEETNASGVAQADYIYLNGRPIATLDPTTGALYFLHDDMLGTPQLATDGSQSTVWQATYQPFGQASVSGTITQNLRFPGQYFDVETGWNHNGFRDYIPDLGRYAEPDPLALRGSARLFNADTGRLLRVPLAPDNESPFDYTANAPTSWIDPFGLCRVDVRYFKLGPNWYHAYLVATDTDGSQTFFRGGPSAGGPSSGTTGALTSGFSGSASGSSSGSSNSSQSSNSSSPGSSPHGGGNYGPWGALHANSGPYVPGSIDWDSGTPPSQTLLNNSSPCTCVLHSFQNYENKINNANIPYNPFSTNSNAFAHGAIGAAGLPVPTPPVWVPGWNTDLGVH